MTKPNAAMPLVGVVMGSRSDESAMQPTLDTLEELKILFEVRALSAHRAPEKVREYVTSAQERGVEVIIAGAGAAAHLPGVIAGWTTLPVIGVPLPTSDLQGLDSLLSIVQMPGGVPVACMAIGSAGAKNAALFAAQILGLKYDEIKDAYAAYKRKLALGI
jgi:5-(carboxyamino)imidazole ribonucleotide mutase